MCVYDCKFDIYPSTGVEQNLMLCCQLTTGHDRKLCVQSVQLTHQTITLMLMIAAVQYVLSNLARYDWPVRYLCCMYAVSM